MNPSATDPVVSEDSTINEVGNSKVDGVKVSVKTSKSKSQDKSSSKNLVKSFLDKSQASAQGFRSGFLTPGASQFFTRLRQAFIELSRFHYFDPDCHIWIETDISDYAISRVFN